MTTLNESEPDACYRSVKSAHKTDDSFDESLDLMTATHAFGVRSERSAQTQHMFLNISDSRQNFSGCQLILRELELRVKTERLGIECSETERMIAEQSETA